MKCLSLFLFFFFLQARLFCALPITHLYLAHQWINNEQDKSIDEQSFMIGTLFPDIRYLGQISREKTHRAGLSLQDIKESPTSFAAGMHLHAYIDEKREKIVMDCNIYPFIKQVAHGFESTLLKLIEDEILYDQNNNSLTINYLNNIITEELSFGISKEHIQKWHFILQSYLNQRPSQLLANLAKDNQGFFHIPPPIVSEWSHLLTHFSHHPFFIQYVEFLLQQFSKDFHSSQDPCMNE